jgi:predicted nucleotide-binding protein
MASAAAPTLTASRADISRLLQNRIDIGKRLSASGVTGDTINNWIDYNVKLLRMILTGDNLVLEEYLEIDLGVGPWSADVSHHVDALESIRDRLGFFREPNPESEPVTKATQPQDHSAAAPRDFSKVFVVHGHDGEPKAEVARFIEKIGFNAVILHELPNRGRTIITKFREEAAGAGFAVILMTPDDHGGITGQDTRPRARQNVIFELGFFIGALGSDRVHALVKGGVERPSDFDGVVYTELDARGAWKQALGQELQAAGFKIDWNKVMAG